MNEIDLTRLCYYDRRNPDCPFDDEDIKKYKKYLIESNENCSCENCRYGGTKLTEQLIEMQKTLYTAQDMVEFSEWLNNKEYMLINEAWYNLGHVTILTTNDLLNFWKKETKHEH